MAGASAPWEKVRYLTDAEIEAFVDELDHDGDGMIDYREVEQKLDQVHAELVPRPLPHHFSHESRQDHERHEFLRTLVGSESDRIPRDQFADRVRSWKIPSMEQDREQAESQQEYMRRLGIWRRVRSYWAVHGPEITFTALVVAMQIAFAVWQLVKYLAGDYTEAFGWGVVLAKTCAGALYPTLFFLMLSMSRYFSTFLRSSYYISRFINWDHSQAFHIRISCAALVLATLHAVGHLGGSFVWGSRPANQDAVAALLGPDAVPRPYTAYLGSLPGFTGAAALGLFYVLSLLSIPPVRRRNYEAFQLGHLLMFPIVGLLMAHGTAGLLQWPMLGYWLAFPTLLVLAERLVRLALCFHHIPATLEVLDHDTVVVRTAVPRRRVWAYRPGQYVFLQVPRVSFFQWHPFTVSTCVGDELQLHIKTDGDWTRGLRGLAGDDPAPNTVVDIAIGINGPFGAPAQRFHDFRHAIVVGAGIGITPFSGILADLQARDDEAHRGPGLNAALAPPDEKRAQDQRGDAPDYREATTHAGGGQTTHDAGDGDGDGDGANPDEREREREKEKDIHPAALAPSYRRVDFHWTVRDRNHLAWLSELLNRVARSQQWHAERRRAASASSSERNDKHSNLDIRIHTHVTQRRADLATHVYRWLLELHRTPAHPESPLTGLLSATRFGRPDFVRILDHHYDEMRRHRAALLSGGDRARWADRRFRVGVFFCGTPVIGEILADRCRMLTARGREDGSRIEYHFMMEVFD